MPNTDSRAWPMPTVDGSAGTWGTGLNQLFDDHVEVDVDAIEATADAALPKAGGTMTGELKLLTERYTVTNEGNLNGSITFDLDTANVMYGTVTGDITSISFSNVPSDAVFLTLELTDGGAHAITWPASVKWDGDVDPTLQTSGVDVLILYTRDAGTTWRGFHSGTFGS